MKPRMQRIGGAPLLRGEDAYHSFVLRVPLPEEIALFFQQGHRRGKAAGGDVQPLGNAGGVVGQSVVLRDTRRLNDVHFPHRQIGKLAFRQTLFFDLQNLVEHFHQKPVVASVLVQHLLVVGMYQMGLLAFQVVYFEHSCYRSLDFVVPLELVLIVQLVDLIQLVLDFELHPFVLVG